MPAGYIIDPLPIGIAKDIGTANTPVMMGANDGTLPPYKGAGYIAGDSPDGLVTFNGSPAVRTLDLFDRATNIFIASTESASDGTYRFSGLTLIREFDVRARGSSGSENDMIAARIVPTT